MVSFGSLLVCTVRVARGKADDSCSIVTAFGGYLVGPIGIVLFYFGTFCEGMGVFLVFSFSHGFHLQLILPRTGRDGV